MKPNDKLRVHIINVGHGDSILVEFPDSGRGASRRLRFGLVDAGGTDDAVEPKTLEYLKAFLECRLAGSAGGCDFEFICLTHPHEDHLLGMMPVLEHFCAAGSSPCAPQQFWDCGFRYNTVGYLGILDFLNRRREVQFMRIAAGTEFHYGDVEILVMAPSIDLRNRYDTYGVDLNDASIVLRIRRGDGVAVLTGDAHFDSWGKVCEEFPRTEHLTYPKVYKDGRWVSDKRDPTHEDLVLLSQENQLNCQLLKVAHHGSKNGTSYEYVHRLSPSHFVISCDTDDWYSRRRANWVGKFPHPITRLVIGEQADLYDVASQDIPSLTDPPSQGKVAMTCHDGTVIYSVLRSYCRRDACLGDSRDQPVTAAMLDSVL